MSDEAAELFRPEPSDRRWPTCPLCGERDDIAASRSRIQEMPYLCGSCGSIFAGTEDEWRINRERRERRVHQRLLNAKRAAENPLDLDAMRSPLPRP